MSNNGSNDANNDSRCVTPVDQIMPDPYDDDNVANVLARVLRIDNNAVLENRAAAVDPTWAPRRPGPVSRINNNDDNGAHVQPREAL